MPAAAFRAAAAAVPGLDSWRGALRLAMGLFALAMCNTQIHAPGPSVSVGAYRWINAGILVSWPRAASEEETSSEMARSVINTFTERKFGPNVMSAISPPVCVGQTSTLHCISSSLSSYHMCMTCGSPQLPVYACADFALGCPAL